MIAEAWAESQKQVKAKKQFLRYDQYIDDPAAFGRELLGENYTDAVENVMNSVRDNPVTIARSGNSVGKSHGAARIAVWFFKCFPDSQVYLTAAPPLDNLKRILWGEIMNIVSRHPALFVNDRIKGMGIYRSPLSFIAGVAIPASGTSEEREAKFSGKHAPHQLFIIDEGDAVPDEVYRGTESCMSGEHARLLVMFNPRAMAGPVFQMEKEKRANVVPLSALTHPNVVTGKNVIPGAVTRDITLRRINKWTRPLASLEQMDDYTFHVPKFLVGQTTISEEGIEYPPLPDTPRKITEPSFSYMVLGEYPPQAWGQLISQEWIDAAVSRWHTYVAQYGEIPPAEIKPVMGLDIADDGTDYNVAQLRYGGWVPRPMFWNGLDPDASARRGLQLIREYGVDITYVDGSGVGSSVAPSISRMGQEDDIRAISVKVSEKPLPFIKSEIGEFYSLRDQLWWAVREWLRTDNGSMLPPDQFLLEELRIPTYDTIETNGKIKIMKKEKMRDLIKRSPDRADALCLTFSPYRRATVMRLL